MAQQSNKLIIVAATYGKNVHKDVKALVEGIQAKSGGGIVLDSKADLNKLFGDHEPGADKFFCLKYKYGVYGGELLKTWAERHDAINLPAVQLNAGGILTITIKQAVGLKNQRTFGKQDPYVSVQCGTEKFKTKTHKGGHCDPVWNQAFVFNVDGKDNAMHILIMDEEIGTDSMIGRLDVPIAALCAQNGDVAYPVYDPKSLAKQAGTLLVFCTFRDPNAPMTPTTTSPVTSSPTTTTSPETAPAPVQPAVKIVYVQSPPPQQQVVYQPAPNSPIVYAQPQQPIVYAQPMQPTMQPAMQPVMQPTMQPVMQPTMQPMQPSMQAPMQPYSQPIPVAMPVSTPAPTPAVTVVHHHHYHEKKKDQSMGMSMGMGMGSQPTMGAPSMGSPSMGSVTASMGSMSMGSSSGGHTCSASSKQGGWRWCNKCQSLWYSELNGSTGACSHGGGHDQSGSGSYEVPLESVSACQGQDGWRWCNRCMVMHYSLASGACPSGGSHSTDGSGSYYMCHGGQHDQHGWCWCSKCGAMTYTKSNSKGNCPSGGEHDHSGSGQYQVGHT